MRTPYTDCGVAVPTRPQMMTDNARSENSRRYRSRLECATFVINELTEDTMSTMTKDRLVVVSWDDRPAQASRASGRPTFDGKLCVVTGGHLGDWGVNYGTTKAYETMARAGGRRAVP